MSYMSYRIIAQKYVRGYWNSWWVVCEIPSNKLGLNELLKIRDDALLMKIPIVFDPSILDELRSGDIIAIEDTELKTKVLYEFEELDERGYTKSYHKHRLYE